MPALVKKERLMRGLVNRTWIRAILKNRLALFWILMLIEFQFFTINFLNTKLRAPTDGWDLRISIIDDHLTPHGVWLIPYFIGFSFAVLIPLWATFVMPNKVYRQFILAVALALLVSYVIYIIFPTYVVKPAPASVPGHDIFARTLRSTYEADAEVSSHNAAPSQHVFYALLNMCFVIRYRPRRRVFWFWVILASLICASTLITMRHNSPDLIGGYVVAVGAYYAGVVLGARITDALADEDEPVMVPGYVGKLHRRFLSYWQRQVARRQRRARINADAV
jgi:membrane-associated phospholipid phosphatase